MFGLNFIGMTKEKISIKFLIHLVGERPALWDKTSEAYKDRSLKETSWREICTFITDHYENMPPGPKLEFTKMVTKKWTHIRDSWVKSMKYGYDEVTKLPPKPYIYHNELKFMQKILKCKPRNFDFTITSVDNSQYDEYYSKMEGSQNSIPCEDNEDDEDGQGSNEQQHDDDHNEQSKQHLPLDDSTEPKVENHALADEDDDDDWPLDEDIHAPIIEIKREPNHNMQYDKNSNTTSPRQEQQQQQRNPVKRTRCSIFKKRRENENLSSPSNSFLNENRHWNFFKGILPSVHVLDEDHTLQFQAGVIQLLQKLRHSQKLVAKSTTSNAKKRKTSDDADFEYPVHKVDISKRYSTRGSKNTFDPIGGENLEFESDNE